MCQFAKLTWIALNVISSSKNDQICKMYTENMSSNMTIKKTSLVIKHVRAKMQIENQYNVPIPILKNTLQNIISIL